MKLSRTAALYAALILGSGLWSLLVEGGDKGIWFGLVMAAFAGAGAACLAGNRFRLGAALLAFAILVIGGWFAWEAFVVKGGRAGPRLYLMVAASLVVAGAWIRGVRTARPG